MTHLRAFAAGFLSTLIFHQGLIAILFATGVIPMAAYNMKPTAPLGVPSVISLAFFGGLWGILIWKLIQKFSRQSQIIRAIIYGAVGPTVVAFVVVFPLKGMHPGLSFFFMGLILNGLWGFGLWLLMMPKFKSIGS